MYLLLRKIEKLKNLVQSFENIDIALDYRERVEEFGRYLDTRYTRMFPKGEPQEYRRCDTWLSLVGTQHARGGELCASKEVSLWTDDEIEGFVDREMSNFSLPAD